LRILLFSILCFIIYPVQSIFGQDSLFFHVDTSYVKQNLKQHVRFLANDSMQGRPAGTLFEKTAIDYISSQIQTDIPETHSLMIDSFAYTNYKNIQKTSFNISILPNNTRGPIVLFTAHYDHLESGSKYSKEILNKNKIHPGADDNASSVAVLIELLRLTLPLQGDKNVGFVFFSGHEEGMFGSLSWIEQYKDVYDINYVINLDMTGRLCQNIKKLVVRYHRNKPIAFKKVHQLANNSFFNFLFTEEGFKDTDAVRFSQHNIEAITISTGTHSDYHRITDTEEKINYNGMLEVLLYLKQIIVAIEN
jgi:Iap family predicted aminopeptidase